MSARFDRFRMSYPAINGEVITEGHARCCREHGHATLKEDGVLSAMCPRCGENVHDVGAAQQTGSSGDDGSGLAVVTWFPTGAPVERRADGTLPSVTSIGGYTIIYVTRASDVLCAACAGAPGAESPLTAAPYDEGPAHECEECGAVIESSYGDPDAAKGEDMSAGTAYDAVICAHGGSVIKTYPDDAYVHVTVQFPDFPQREAFLNDLPSHVDWERRTPPCQVVLHVERSDT